MSRTQLALAVMLSCCLLTATGYAAEETIHFREGGGSGYTDVLFDDTWLDNLYGREENTHGNDSNLSYDTDEKPLICIKELFTELPATSGGCSIDIKSATLHLTRYNQGSSSNIVSVYRITTDWVPDDAGSNENDCCDKYSESSTTTSWTSGNFSGSDYDSTPCDTGNWVDDYNEACQIDITDVMAEIYDVGTNYGIVITADGAISFRSSERGTASQRPSIEITYEYVGDTYTLTVNSGTGDGDYAESAVADITADTPPSGQEFDEWVGHTSGIADVSDPTTTLTMPAANQEVTATYTDKTWILTVNSGTGDGSYAVATEVPISADTAPSGQDFAEWIGDTEEIASLTSASTTLTMPYGNAEVTATYTDKTWTLTVNSGSGDGDYVVATVVDVAADAASSGYAFDSWTGDVSGLADGEDPSTTYTMPYRNAEITATYVNVYALTVNSGTGDGTYEVGTIVNISADDAASGKTFDQWVGDTSNIADVNASDTTITMPSSDAEITATYANIQWTLTVNSGTGDGTYDAGTVVDITADAAPSGYAFEEWIGDTEDVLDVLDPTTKVTMPIHDVEVTAAYTEIHWDLTVNSGSGDGDYAVNTIVDITADAAPSGSLFDKWTGDTSGIADVNDPFTTLTMPGGDAEITATYAEVVDGLVSRFTFDIDARDNYGTNDGTLTNGASVAQDAARGPVLELDGDNDYVDLPADNMAAGRSEMTLSLWVKPDSWAGSDTVYDEYTEAVYWQFSVTGSTFYTRDSSTGTMGSRDNDVSMPSVPTGEWHHLAVTYSVSGGKKAVYYDGTEYASTTTSIDTLTSDREGARIGYACDGAYFDGRVDDVRLYNRALSAQEVAIVAGNPLYTLIVNSGSGDGDYTEDTVVNISADTAPSGQDFDEWTGDTTTIANVNLSSTTITMPGADAEITATYADKEWTLTVNSGSGGGSYSVDTIVDISADAAPSGKVFDDWEGDTSTIADVNDPTTTITMPYGNAEITATYADNVYTLTVNSGSGDGSYTPSTVVNISADAAPSGKVFDDWVGDTSNIADVNASSTTLTMPAANQEITATYEDAATGTESIHFREGGGEGYTDVTFDDTYLNVSPADNTTHGDAGYNGLFMDKRDGQTGRVVLLAIKDLFTELPLTSGGQAITVHEATLRIIRYQGSTDTIISVNRVTTNWLPDTAGSNEDDVSGENAEASEPTSWASGDFSSSDYDTSETATETFSNDYNGLTEIDVTELVEDIYDAEVNYGLVLQCEDDKYAVGRASEHSSSPRLEIVYSYGSGGPPPPTYTLTVNNGTGDGDYAANTVVGIDADSPASGQVFDEWVGDTTGIAALTSASTTITMPASNAEITATYAAATLYTLTVNSGTGDGSYQEGWVVDITADAAPSGQEFDEWIGDTSGIANLTASSTTITMPGSNAEITATYADLGTTYTLTVNSGTGDGDYLPGTVVDIAADSPPAEKAFDEWIGDTNNIADVHDSTTTITMPSANAEITATYADTYTLTVNSGSGDGDYLAGAVVNISADTPPSGKAFDEWVGDTTDVANVNAADTTVTMPSADVEVTATYADIGPGPSINSTSGTWAHGNSVTIYGSSFGSHGDYGGSQDFLCRGWFDFETGGLAGGNFTCENSNVWQIRTTSTRNNSSYHGRKVYNGTRLGAMKVQTLDNTHEFYSSFWIMLDSSGNDAGKIWRIWSDIHSDNIYLATGTTNTMIRGFSESQRCDPPPSTQWSSPNSLGYNQWHRLEIWMDDNPSEFTVWMDGIYQWSHDNWVPYPWYSGNHTWQFGHMINDCTGGHNFDDLFADNTRARVEIGNASTWAGCTQREIQIPTGWSNSTITIKANKGAFSSFSGKYLYVVDSSGNVSAGYGL